MFDSMGFLFHLVGMCARVAVRRFTTIRSVEAVAGGLQGGGRDWPGGWLTGSVEAAWSHSIRTLKKPVNAADASRASSGATGRLYLAERIVTASVAFSE
jgi:hypothetical protein